MRHSYMQEWRAFDQKRKSKHGMKEYQRWLALGLDLHDAPSVMSRECQQRQQHGHSWLLWRS